MGDSKTVLTRHAKILRSGDTKVGGMVMQQLSAMGDAGLALMLKQLGHRSSGMRGRAVHYLSKKKNEPAVKEFIATALKSEDPNLLDGARRLVGQADGRRSSETKPEADPGVLAASLRGNSLDGRQAVRQQLVKLGSPAVPALMRLLEDEDGELRVVVAELLGEIADPSAVPGLIAALGDRAPAVRAQAAGALARVGDRRALPALMKAVGDTAPGVREAVLASLGHFSEPSACDLLVKALDDESWRSRRAAAAALAGHKTADATEALSTTLAEDTHPSVRRAAAAALAHGHTPQGVPSLNTALGDKHWSVRLMARENLKAMPK
jgi:HEAT repeat protein